MRSLGIVISVSTFDSKSAIDVSAVVIRLRPSNANGLVTTAIVSAPESRAISAITGAAPLPVPPPIPAVMNTRSEPSRTIARSSREASAASRPSVGFAPAPRPRV